MNNDIKLEKVCDYTGIILACIAITGLFIIPDFHFKMLYYITFLIPAILFAVGAFINWDKRFEKKTEEYFNRINCLTIDFT